MSERGRQIIDLKRASDEECLGKFIRQHERKPETPHARQRFIRLLDSMARSSQSGERTSKQEPSQD
jgi:hypothetical protein